MFLITAAIFKILEACFREDCKYEDTDLKKVIQKNSLKVSLKTTN